MSEANEVAQSTPRVFSSVQELKAAEGESLGPSQWIIVTQDQIDEFARVTNDWQPLHNDPQVGQASVYGATIMHGYFTMSLLSWFAGQLYRIDNVKHIINYGIDALRFPAAIPVDTRFRAHGKVLGVDLDRPMPLVRIRYEVEVENNQKPALVADTVIAIDEQ